jgi:DNA-binding PadR family transcriptional regulator
MKDILNVRALLLLAILNQGDSYVYQMVKIIKTTTGGAIRPGLSRVYAELFQMVRDGWVTRSSRLQHGKLAHYYRLTPKGAQVYRVMLRDWDQTTAAVDEAIASLSGQSQIADSSAERTDE